MLLNGRAFLFNKLNVQAEEVDHKNHIFKFIKDGQPFLVAFVFVGIRIKLIIFSYENWRAFKSDESLGVKLKLTKKTKVIDNSIFDTLVKYKDGSNEDLIKIIITNKKTRTFVVDENDTEFVKPEDLVNGIHIINESKFIKYINRFNDERLKKSSIHYTV
jgi:hypothetical protein